MTGINHTPFERRKNFLSTNNKMVLSKQIYRRDMRIEILRNSFSVVFQRRKIYVRTLHSIQLFFELDFLDRKISHSRVLKDLLKIQISRPVEPLVKFYKKNRYLLLNRCVDGKNQVGIESISFIAITLIPSLISNMCKHLVIKFDTKVLHLHI